MLTRLRALQQAADIGWEEVLGVVALTERLHPEPAVRARAALDGASTLTWAIVRHGPDAVDPVCARLADPDARARVRRLGLPGSDSLTDALARFGPAALGPVLAALRRLMRDRSQPPPA